MKRDDITKVFPEATKEQIDQILDQAGAELTALQERLSEAAGKVEDMTNKYTEASDKLIKLTSENSDLAKKVQAGMTAEQLLEQREKEAAAKELDFAIKSNTLDAREIFQGSGLTGEEVEELVKQVVSEDAEKTKTLATQIAALTKAQREEAAQAKQDELLKNNPSLNGGGTDNTGLTKEKFNAMSFDEQATLIKENPSLLSTLN